MTTFVLVHGAFHGGWCWHKIVARLEAEGHTVFAPDMPGHGIDKTPIADVTRRVSRWCWSATPMAAR